MKESILRTLVPIIYALLIKAGLGEWLGLDDPFLQSLAAAIGAGLLYVGLRVAERYKPQIGWLLGYASQPAYSDNPPPNRPPVTLDREEAGAVDLIMLGLILVVVGILVWVLAYGVLSTLGLVTLVIGIVCLVVGFVRRDRASL